MRVYHEQAGKFGARSIPDPTMLVLDAAVLVLAADMIGLGYVVQHNLCIILKEHLESVPSLLRGREITPFTTVNVKHTGAFD